MSAPTPATLPRSSGFKVLFRVIASLVVLVAIAIALVGGWFYYAGHSALPQVEGTIRVAGLSAPVRVLRDAQGVPHISAANLLDLCFAQGYVTAQDRLWQMDVTRRFAAGEMSEVLGPQMLGHDRQQRILQIRATADRMAVAADPTSRAYIEAYTRGANAFIDTHKNSLPLEFRLLRYQPRPWLPRDGLMIGVYMSELLSLGGGKIDLNREKILAKLTPELAADLYPTSSWHDHPPGEVRVKMDQIAPGDEDDEDEDGVEEMRRTRATIIGALTSNGGEQLVPGSNDWVVSGEHTTSGKPLLSNDTHLPHSIPNTWYEIHLSTAGDKPLDVAGFSLPGIPFVIIGHNRRIAWGFTNTGADVSDFYQESFNSNGEYETPQGFRKPEIRQEVIRVKGQQDVNLDVAVTRHGPIVTDLLPGETRKLALRWVPYEAGASLAFADFDAAQNWDDFQRALSHFDSPSQNVVYADADGHIGYHATGKIPIHPQNPTAGPLNGADDKQEWAGFIPFDRLPSAFDPPGGVIATANNRITPKKYPFPLQSEWGAPYRAERIYRVLESGRKFAANDMIALQTDVQSEFDRFCAERFVYAVDRSKDASARARQAADLMRSWDGRMSIDAAAPVIETEARKELWRRLLEPKLSADYVYYSPGVRAIALENILVHQPARWLPKEYASFDDLLAATVEHVITRPHVPSDLSTWRWGTEHSLYMQHPVFGRIPIIDRWSGPGLKPQSGGSYTVKQVGREFGPSERMTVDLADLDGTASNLVTGESGQLFSANYLDQFQAWYEGYSFPFAFNEAAVRAAKKHELTLEPGGN